MAKRSKPPGPTNEPEDDPAPASGPSEKLHKALAAAGLGSRREIERWIAAGRVSVNGEPAHVGQRVAASDRLEVDGKRVKHQGAAATEVLVLNKAAGVVCTRHDPEGRTTVFDDLPKLHSGRWVSVGRLDIQTSGLLVLTSDGALAHKMMHPSTGLDREYAVRVNGKLEDEALEALKQGVDVDGEILRFSDIQFFNGSGSNFWYHVVLLEGKNREVRRLFEAAGHTVSRLKRVRYGPIILPSWLKNKQWARLLDSDIEALYKLLSLPYTKPRHRKGPRYVAKTTCLLPYPSLEPGGRPRSA